MKENCERGNVFVYIYTVTKPLEKQHSADLQEVIQCLWNE